MEPAKILVVDDEAAILRLLKEALSQWGYQVTGASSGAEALQALRGDMFDAVITDIRMPDMNGLELLKEIKRHDDLDRLVVTLDLFEELEAVHVGHADVGDDCVEHVAAERLERLGGARCRRHLIAPLCEGFPEEPKDRGLVVNYQDLCRFHRLTDSDFTRRGVRLTSFS